MNEVPKNDDLNQPSNVQSSDVVQQMAPSTQMQGDFTELKEPKQEVKASPLILIVSSLCLIVVFKIGLNLYSSQSKASPSASIVQIQTEMQKTEGEKNNTIDKITPENSSKTITGETKDDFQKQGENELKGKSEGSNTKNDGNNAEPENKQDLSETLGTDVIQNKKIER